MPESKKMFRYRFRVDVYADPSSPADIASASELKGTLADVIAGAFDLPVECEQVGVVTTAKVPVKTAPVED